MRIRTAKETAATAGQVQAPAYLVELGFSTPIRASSRGSVDWGGYTWPAIGLRVGEINTGQGGARSVSISVANNAFAFSQIVLAETASGKTAKVYKLFGPAPFATEDAVLVFDGVIDDVPELVTRVTFNCSTQNARTLQIPNVTIGAPYFTHMPRAGQVIFWAGESYELQAR